MEFWNDNHMYTHYCSMAEMNSIEVNIAREVYTC